MTVSLLSSRALEIPAYVANTFLSILALIALYIAFFMDCLVNILEYYWLGV